MPNAAAGLPGGKPSRPPGVSPSARASISRTIDESQLLLISAALATGGVGEVLMVSMNSSMLASATARPSSTWPRSRALRSSNTVRRVTTSRRCSRKIAIRSFRLHSLGWLSISATMFMPKVSCSCVCLYRLFSTTSGTSPRLSSITTRMPDLSDSSWMWLMPSSFFSWTSSAMRSSRFFLFTWYGISSTMIAWRWPLVDVLEMALGAHHHPAAAGAVAVAHAGGAVDDAGGREVGRRDDLDQLVDRRLGVLQQVQAGVDDLVEVVRRDVGRHADRDAARAVDQQVGQPRRQTSGSFSVPS